MKKNFKRTLAYLMAVMMLISVMPVVNVFAASSGTCGENLTWTLDSGTLTISGTGEMTDYYWVESPWYSNSLIKNVIINDGVKSIGNYAFRHCTSLTSVTIPDSVTDIGWYSFCDCTSLTSITIPDSVTSIGEEAFGECISLTSVTIGNGVRSIGECAFEGCTGLTSITIPNSVTSIGEFAFAHCTGITSITIPNSVTNIGYGTFYSCTGLTSITVDENNANYSSEDGVLFNKDKTELIRYPMGNSRTEYTIPDVVTSISDCAFYGCAGLTSVVIPDSVTNIGAGAFYNCTGLTSVTIGNSVTNIGELAFYGCISLTNIAIPESVTSIADSAFALCFSLTSIVIPYSVTSIDELAFYGCISLTNIAIPESVTNIGEDAFSTCLSLNKIIIRNRKLDLTYTGFGYSNIKLKVSIDELIEKYKQAMMFGENYDMLDSLYDEYDEPEPIEDATIYGYIGSTAQIYAIENDLSFIPLDNENSFIALTGEKTLLTENFRVYGWTNPNTQVSIICDGAVIGSTVSSENGRWSFEGTLPNAQDGNGYTLTAQITDGEETITSDPLEITYDSQAVLFESFDTRHKGQSYLIRPETMGKAARYISVSTSYPITFVVKLKNNQKVNNVKVVAVGSNETREYQAVYDENSGSWIATAYFNSNFVPNDIYIVYNDDEIIDPDYKCKFIIDPSGNVYEAVKSNTLDGVTAKIYYKDNDGNEILWDADAFDQLNPQITLADGSFKWEVPGGLWQVRFTKDGYETAYTDWLEVPPEYTNLVVPMVTTLAPKVEYVNAYTNGAEIRFSQYMDIDSVNSETVSIGNVTGTWTAVDAEESLTDDSVMYAKTFKFTTVETLPETVSISVSGCKNYAGIEMEEEYNCELFTKTELTSIEAPETVEVVMGESETIDIAILPKDAASGSITITNLDDKIAKTEESVDLSKSGTANIKIDGLLLGTTELTITLKGTSLESKIKVVVVSPKEEEHVHAYTATVTAPTCTEKGYTTYTCECGDSYKDDYVDATGHNNVNGTCTVCGHDFTKDCGCKCHKSGFTLFIWKISNLFHKLFKMDKYYECACGRHHW